MTEAGETCRSSVLPMSDDHGRDPSTATTWHHGLIARWWANFNLDGPEIEFFRSYVAAGQPALDVGCGSGRLLVPWVADGLDVDGVDASADMIEACRVAARNAGCEPVLYVQPTHRLDLPRRYRTIISCGAFGLGGSRADDTEGLRRLRAHLLPGGVLALDYQVGEFDDDRWSRWQPRPADEAPPPSQTRRLAPDGFHYALRHRLVAVDVADRSVTRGCAPSSRRWRSCACWAATTAVHRPSSTGSTSSSRPRCDGNCAGRLDASLKEVNQRGMLAEQAQQVVASAPDRTVG